MSDICVGTKKLRFPDEKSALAELAKITVRAINGERSGRRHWVDDGQPLETGAFECTYCGCWHLTARPWDDLIVNRKSGEKDG